MTLAKPKILVVDDRAENLFSMEKLLANLDAQVLLADSGAEGLRLALEHDFCVAIVDIQMPEIDGYQFVELLRSNQDTATLPAIFVSAIYSDEYHHRKGYEAGAVDFLSKPFVPEILISKVKVFMDLHQQRKALEEANVVLEQQREALQKLNADKDRFFSIISHDLRGPFNVLLGSTDLLQMLGDSLTPTDMVEIGASIHRAAKAAHDLVENLLIWSRMQLHDGMKLHPESIELKGLVEETVALFEQTALQKGIEINNRVGGDVWVQSDRNMLATVIRNLTGNALKFTPRGGCIDLAVLEGLTGGSPEAVTCMVKDTGVGMSPEDVAKLFKLGEQRSRPGTEKEPGSGLGLLICREMVEWNGGKIWAESTPGKGTAMNFTVPRATPPEH